MPTAANTSSGIATSASIARRTRILNLLAKGCTLERWGNQLPPWLQRINQPRSLIWNIGIGMIIVLSLLRWLLQR
jgi:hypothetical protein